MVRFAVHDCATVTHLDVDLVLLVWVHGDSVERLEAVGCRGVEDEEGQGCGRGQRVWYDDRPSSMLMTGLRLCQVGER